MISAVRRGGVLAVIGVSLLGCDLFDEWGDDPEGSSNTPVVTISDTRVLEGDLDQKTIAFELLLSEAIARSVTVVYEIDAASADAGTDFLVPDEQRVVFAAGEDQQTLSLTVLGDVLDEADETFTIRLTSASNADLSVSQRAAVGTIEDNDGEPTVEFSRRTQSVDEGGDVTVTFSLSAPSSFDVSLPFSIEGTASAEDYNLSSSGPIVIPAGELNGVLTLTAVDDDLVELNELVQFNIDDPTYAQMPQGGIATHSITIRSDDFFGGMNDTGQTQCGTDLNYVACTSIDDSNVVLYDSPLDLDDWQTGETVSEHYPGQDAQFGRDLGFQSSEDGSYGFSFTRLDDEGDPKASQSSHYSEDPWACVQDNVTGLYWEVKTDDDGLRDRDHSYTWFQVTDQQRIDIGGYVDGGSGDRMLQPELDGEALVILSNEPVIPNGFDAAAPGYDFNDPLNSDTSFGDYGTADTCGGVLSEPIAQSATGPILDGASQQVDPNEDLNANGSIDTTCNTRAYVRAVNEQRLCGRDDWRLPTVEELRGVANYGELEPGPAIDRAFFPNAQRVPSNGAIRETWTAETVSGSVDEARYIDFTTGVDEVASKSSTYRIRLVAGAGSINTFSESSACDSTIGRNSHDDRYSVDGLEGTVTDTQTGLMWATCSLGQSFNNLNYSCAGSATVWATWTEALLGAQAINSGGGYAGHEDWRMPNVKELSSLAERACPAPSIVQTDAALSVTTSGGNLDINQLFPSTPLWRYWSSTSALRELNPIQPGEDPGFHRAFISVPGSAWHVEFENQGIVSSTRKEITFRGLHVRLVRDVE